MSAETIKAKSMSAMKIRPSLTGSKLLAGIIGNGQGSRELGEFLFPSTGKHKQLLRVLALIVVPLVFALGITIFQLTENFLYQQKSET